MMNSARFQGIYNGLNSIAQKVYCAVPIAEHWTLQQIHTELARTGKAQTIAVTQGCLKALTLAGIVHLSRTGEFIRAPIRGKKSPEQPAKTEEPVATPLTVVTPAVISPIDKLTNLSARLRTLAEDIDNVALDFTEQLASSEQQSAKLRQLQTLLKELA